MTVALACHRWILRHPSLSDHHLLAKLSELDDMYKVIQTYRDKKESTEPDNLEVGPVIRLTVKTVVDTGRLVMKDIGREMQKK